MLNLRGGRSVNKFTAVAAALKETGKKKKREKNKTRRKEKRKEKRKSTRAPGVV